MGELNKAIWFEEKFVSLPEAEWKWTGLDFASSVIWFECWVPALSVEKVYIIKINNKAKEIL